jgi:hypothetical protein
MAGQKHDARLACAFAQISRLPLRFEHASKTCMPGTRLRQRLRRVRSQSGEALAKPGTRPGMTGWWNHRARKYGEPGPLSETYAKVSLSCAKLTAAVRFLLL